MAKHGSKLLAFAMVLFVAASARMAVAAPELRAFAIGEDLFVGGQGVIVQQASVGEMIVAGDNVQLQAPIAGDLMAAGERSAPLSPSPSWH